MGAKQHAGFTTRCLKIAYSSGLQAGEQLIGRQLAQYGGAVVAWQGEGTPARPSAANPQSSRSANNAVLR